MSRKCSFCGRPVERDPRAKFCEPRCKRAIEGIGSALVRACEVWEADPTTRERVLFSFESAVRTFREGTEPKQQSLPVATPGENPSRGRRRNL